MTRLTLVEPTDVPPDFKIVAQARLLRDLNVAGHIDQYSVWVGMQVLARMADVKSPTVVITQNDIAATWVTYKGEILARPVLVHAARFTRALQELQQTAGMRNALTPGLMPDDIDEVHFSLDPRAATPAFAPDTPIYFRGDAEMQQRLRAFIDDDLNPAMRLRATEMQIG